MNTRLLIVGAGPFGLSIAAHAKHLGIEFIIVGKPMEFWKMNMPEGMYLRSACDWHLDPENEHTIEKFLSSQDLTPKDVEPLSRNFYLSYTEWFMQQKKITALPVCINRLDHISDHHYRAVLSVGIFVYKHCPGTFIWRNVGT